MSHLITAVKRAVRPLIPDRLMARYRLIQHSRFSRTNVDVFTDRDAARRWLVATPDTYRVKLSLPAPGPAEAVVVPEGGQHVEEARALLGDPEVSIGVVAETPPPRLVDRRRSEPLLAPLAIAAHRHVLDEVGWSTGQDGGPAALWRRLRTAGFRIGLRPIPPSGRGAPASDPIAGDVALVVSAVPLHDIGGGSRAAQIAGELLRRDLHVVYVSLYPALESVDLGLRFMHPALEQYDATEFDAEELAERVAAPGLVVVEVPHQRCLALARHLSGQGWTVVYDMIDDWSDPALGGDWYTSTVEHDLADLAQLVTASASDLVERAARVVGRDAVLLPNAVNDAVFTGAATERPSDLPDGEVLGYHGSLYGDWFDWGALRAVAEANRDAAVVVIGDLKSDPPPLPGNVRLLGLRPQTDLPAYLCWFRVGLVPFAVTATTHAVSPLKVYEYLASGVPVAAPPLRSLRGLDGVYVADDLVEAVARARTAPPPDGARARAEHSWQARIDELWRRLGWEPPPRPAAPLRTAIRPAVHYAKGERLLP